MIRLTQVFVDSRELNSCRLDDIVHVDTIRLLETVLVEHPSTRIIGACY